MVGHRMNAIGERTNERWEDNDEDNRNEDRHSTAHTTTGECLSVHPQAHYYRAQLYTYTRWCLTRMPTLSMEQ